MSRVIRRRRTGRRLAFALFTLIAAAGCASRTPGQVDARSSDLAGARCDTKPPALLPGGAGAARDDSAGERLLAALVSADGGELVLFDARHRKVRWRAEGPFRDRPQILRDVVVITTDGVLVAYEIESGARRFALPLERPAWLGAAQHGEVVVFAMADLTFAAGARGSTLTAVDAKTGAVRWAHRERGIVGKPIAHGGRIHALRDGHELLAFDAERGRELGCTPLAGEASWLRSEGGTLFHGASDLRAWRTPAVREERLVLPELELPGSPELEPSGYTPVPAARSAHGRVGRAATPELDDAGALVLSADRLYLVYYRHLFAYRADGTLAWARRLEHDVVLAKSAAGELFAVTESGDLLRFHAADGVMEILGTAAVATASADLDAASRLPAGPSATPSGDLLSSLGDLALDPDARLVPSKRMAASALAALDEPRATEVLLRIYAQSAAAPALRDHIAELLRARRVGTEHLISALGAHEDFLHDQPAPPLRLLVPAVAARRESQALPLLIDHLFDPATKLFDLDLLVSAIGEIGGDAAYDALFRFLRLYRADSAFAEDPSALASAARALLHHGSPEQRSELERLFVDPRTSTALRDELAALATTHEPDAGAGVESEHTASPELATLPPTLSRDAIERTLESHATELRACLEEERARTPELASVRLAFVVESEGRIEMLKLAPDRPELTACLDAKLRGVRFPAFRAGRRLASYTLRASAPEQGDDTRPAPSQELDARPFWALSVARAPRDARVPTTKPWWQDQNALFLSIEPSTARAASADAQRSPRTSPDAHEAREAPAEPNAHEARETPAEAEDAWWVPSTP